MRDIFIVIASVLLLLAACQKIVVMNGETGSYTETESVDLDRDIDISKKEPEKVLGNRLKER